MLDIVTTKVFDKDYKLLKKRGYNLNLIKEVIEMLADENIKKISQNELKSVMKEEISSCIIRIYFFF